jgi:hypothetical protein
MEINIMIIFLGYPQLINNNFSLDNKLNRNKQMAGLQSNELLLKIINRNGRGIL